MGRTLRTWRRETPRPNRTPLPNRYQRTGVMACTQMANSLLATGGQLILSIVNGTTTSSVAATDDGGSGTARAGF